MRGVFDPDGSALLIFPILCLFVLAIVLGGGTRQGLWSDAIVQLASVPLIGLSLWRISRRAASASNNWALALVAATLLLPVLQMVPLPPSVWTRLPGRTTVVSAYQLAGLPLPYVPISLSTPTTVRSFLALMPAVAVFLATLSLDRRARSGVALAVLVLAFADMLLGLAQLVDGPQSPLRLYQITNRDQAVGFFANRNHNAALLYCAIPLVTALVVSLIGDRRGRRAVGIFLLVASYGAYLLGLATTQSRAGLLLALVSASASALVALRALGRQGLRRGLTISIALANLVGLGVAFQFGFVAIAQRVETDSVLDDLRWQVAGVTARAAIAYLPFGTGFGTFQRIYETIEPPALLRDVYVNHAHDDWLELLLEGGLPALALAVGFLLWFAAAAIPLWRSNPSRDARGTDRTLQRAGCIIVAVLLLHSTLDYPLRTTAIMTLFAFACALTLPPAPRRSAEPRRSQARLHAGKGGTLPRILSFGRLKARDGEIRIRR